ncbi:PREDICTED: dihydrolipoyllysine-residue acetyltransferase component of pyruvate dehydrogenase complex, mitochondrial-like [Polistes canadensis]|uniref:dihydrolipoyllysine-residue acetyltransferase component of pyruvate dehydrogenase complex, mitochondrial-like n=1 Tax=Polistes canadensis TaxID=91411 RepID=UPI000718B423|nr:PREDICTED: dihydrolipoyllysine-residue acetyltransferase component of pyruvate dehydrogenase complex, mitochondrial-like [Polistes canadensis]
MAHTISRSRLVVLFALKYTNRIKSRNLIPLKYQRLCFHTNWILEAKGKELFMPSLSPTMESGTIVKWLKKEGDKINPGDAIADIQTDKAVVAMEVEDEVVLAKIIVPEGTKDIKVGTLIALTVDEGEDWKSVEAPDTSPTPSTKPTTAPTPSAPSVSQSDVPPPPGQQNVSMPALSPTMTTGTIVKWLKREGDEIQPGDAIAEIQTDKAVMTFEMEDEAVLAKILVPEGSQVEVGQLIAVTVEKGMDWTKAVIPQTLKATTPSPAPAVAKSSEKEQVYGLAVKRLLQEYGLDANFIKGTGRPNRILKSDVLAYIETNNIKKVQLKADTVAPPKVEKGKKAEPMVPGRPSAYEDIPVSNIRSVIAKRLGESKSNIPHSYSSIDIKIDKLIEIRKQLKEDGINVSVNDFITKAVSHALVECSTINTLYTNNKVVRAPNIDISIAVASPMGLITPIVFDAPSKSLLDISTTIRELAGKAKAGTLKPQEFQGGSFTISNLGMFGIKEFSAIINPPQTAILAVGTGRPELSDSLETVTKMMATLSYDRRAIAEDDAADFLAVLRAMLENPTFLAVGKIQALRHMND